MSLISSAAETVLIFLQNVVSSSQLTDSEPKEIHLRIGMTSECLVHLAQHATSNLYSSAMVLATVYGHANLRGVQENAERFVRDASPSTIAGFNVIIDNAKKRDCESLDTRAHSSFCKMLQDINSEATMCAVQVMSSTSLLEWNDEGIAAYSFWWKLIDADALSVYLLGSVISATDARMRKHLDSHV